MIAEMAAHVRVHVKLPPAMRPRAAESCGWRQRMSRTVYQGIVLTCRAGMGIEVNAQAAWAVELLVAVWAVVLL